jgi:XRE family transcriptional regulator, regulator of sulfur utilization
MITRRDAVVAVVAACVAVTFVTWADSPTKPIMHSSVFNWSDFKVETTKYGARRQAFDARTATLDAFDCHITTLNPGQIPHAAHHHPEEELLVVKEGTLQVMQNGVTNQAGPGAIIFQASNEEHGVRNAGDVPVTYYVFRWTTASTPKSPQQ